MVQVGEPRKTIIDVASRLPADLLVIGAHSKRSVFDVVLGGTAAYLSRHAPCPMVMVTPTRTP
jgi:nucleotide-binding universal stress UspA family protein